MRELSLHILDLIENSLAAHASRIVVEVDESSEEDRLTITITDNGCGMDPETAALALDAFFSTRRTRHIGLGLPLCEAATKRCNGRFRLESASGRGTRVTMQFPRSHIDRAPLGNMPDTIMSILLSDKPVDLQYIHRVDDVCFQFDTREVREILGDVPLSHPAVRNWLAEFLREGEAGLQAVQPKTCHTVFAR